ncbi:MAG: sulfotransferase domain-containing protein, partial [Longimicrobiales bacterium]
LIAQAVYLSVVLSWEDQQTRGLGYYGLPPEGRQRFKRKLRTHARLLYPILRLIGRTSSFTFEKASFRHRDVAGPRGTCSEASFARADAYAARPEDIFVVTQMKCGTTWMQHVVYEVLMRGEGDIVEAGTTLYALSPWLEAQKSVPVEEAPLIGTERPSRIIKTHLPVQLCPYSREARYVYVVRHPVSCFASCVDFVATNIGAMAPDLPAVESWFRSPELMWWGSWTDHVKGWWERARTESNVLVVHFEEMKRDLPAVARRVADFLGVAPLTDVEVDGIVVKCGFAYMRRHKDAFEMNPPHILQTDAELFVRGTADRHADVPEDTRQRLLAWCAREMEGSDFPLDEVYPDVAAVGVAR